MRDAHLELQPSSITSNHFRGSGSCFGELRLATKMGRMSDRNYPERTVEATHMHFLRIKNTQTVQIIEKRPRNTSGFAISLFMSGS